MSTLTKYKGFKRSTIEELSAFKAEPSWMLDVRLAAWDQYQSNPLPVQPLGVLLHTISPFSEPPKDPIPSESWPRDLQHALEERGDEEGLIVQRDATILSRSISKEQTKKGVIFTDLDSAVKIVPDLVQRSFASLVKPDQPLTTLHTAFWSGGTLLYVPEYLDVTLPFHTCYWLSDPRWGIFPRTLMVIGKGSRVSFIDEYVSTSWPQPGMSIAVVEALVSETARVHYVNIQNWGQGVHHHLVQQSSVKPEGQFISYHVDMGGRQPKHRIETMTSEVGQVRLLESAEFEDEASLESIFQQLPISSVAEKLRQYLEGWLTGHRPSMTLERVAQLHPEVRV